MYKKTTAARPYLSKYPDPVRFRRGDRIVLGHRDAEFPGWIRVTDPRGRSGWAPESILDSVGGADAEAIEDYEATELDVSPGDRLTVHKQVAGWLWVCNEHGEQGWVPVSVTGDESP